VHALMHLCRHPADLLQSAIRLSNAQYDQPDVLARLHAYQTKVRAPSDTLMHRCMHTHTLSMDPTLW
jgi:hypothetical protein